MSKSSYRDFSNHMLYSYFQPADGKLLTDADKLNRQAAEMAIGEMSEANRKIVVRIFGGGRRIDGSVDDCSAETGVNPPEIWHIIRNAQRRVAELRGLI